MSVQDKLHDLFLLDQQVRGLSGRLDAAKRRLRAQTVKLEQLQQQHRELEDQLKHKAAHAATLEHEANAVQGRIDTLRERLANITNNKEYSAVLVEVNTLKIEHGKKEEEALAEMEGRDQLKVELDALAQKVEDQKKVVAGADAEVAERQAEVGDRLAEVTAERDAAKAQVRGDALATYERAANANDGEAMAPIIEEDRRRREYSCGGCYMSMPVEQVNALMSRPDEVVVCGSCVRILYVAEKLKAEMAK